MKWFFIVCLIWALICLAVILYGLFKIRKIQAYAPTAAKMKKVRGFLKFWANNPIAYEKAVSNFSDRYLGRIIWAYLLLLLEVLVLIGSGAIWLIIAVSQ